jgi:hypothetical protein
VVDRTRSCTASRPRPTVSQHDAALVFGGLAAKTCHVTRLAGRLLALVAALLFAGGLAVIHPGRAYACSCAGISTRRALDESDAAFRGTVLAKTDVGRRADARTDIRFRVDAVYKGTVYRDQVVASARDSASCGLDPDVGSTWVIFAQSGIEGTGDDTVSRLITGLCHGNIPSGIAPTILGPPRQPLDGASDREERSLNADKTLTRGLAIGGIAVLFVGSLAAIGLGVLWGPGRAKS